MGTYDAKAKGGNLVSYAFFAGAALTVAAGIAMASMTRVHFVAFGTLGGTAFTVGAPDTEVETGGTPRLAANLKVRVQPWWGTQHAKMGVSLAGGPGRGFRWTARAAAVDEAAEENRRGTPESDDECAKLDQSLGAPKPPSQATGGC